MSRQEIAEFVRALAGPPAYARETDRELLDRFLTDRDEAAFEVLVRRHEPLVRAAISRVLVEPADAADAIQATFLVLVRRAARIDWRADLGPWLYGVAHRVAVRERATNRRKPDALGATDPADPHRSPDADLREACNLLHIELDRLPERFRLPLLLCYLEGNTRDEAAVALGVSVGTVKGRVRRGCELLRRRLARRGVTLSVGLLAGVAPRPALATPVAGMAAVVNAPSPRIAELVREVSGVMISTKLKLITLAIVAVAGMAFALGRPEVVATSVTAQVAPVPKQATPPVFLVQISSVNTILDASGKEIKRFDRTTNGALSPDGNWLASADFSESNDGNKNGKLVIRPWRDRGESVTVPRDLGEPGRSGTGICWSRDGKRLVVSEDRTRREDDTWVHDYRFWVYDIATKKVTDLNLPNVTWISDWSLDGKRLLVSIPIEGQVHGWAAWINADGSGEPEFLTPDGELAVGARLSPAGDRILYQRYTRSWFGLWSKPRLYVLDLATKKRTVVDEPGETDSYCWSPDGKRIAYTWQRPAEDWSKVPVRETFLITCDPDGNNRTTVTSRKVESERSTAVMFFKVRDWR